MSQGAVQRRRDQSVASAARASPPSAQLAPKGLWAGNRTSPSGRRQKKQTLNSSLGNQRMGAWTPISEGCLAIMRNRIRCVVDPRYSVGTRKTGCTSAWSIQKLGWPGLGFSVYRLVFAGIFSIVLNLGFRIERV